LAGKPASQRSNSFDAPIAYGLDLDQDSRIGLIDPGSGYPRSAGDSRRRDRPSEARLG
jgi:hypothetical protein